MLRNRSIIALLAVSALFVSCSRHSLNPEEYVKWVQDEANGLAEKKIIGEYEFTARYCPQELLAIQDLGMDSLQPERISQKTKEYANTQAFVFKIATTDHKADVLKNGIGSSNEYYGRLQYFTNAVQRDFLVACGNDTISCSLCNFERTYSAGPFSTFMLYFEAGKDLSGQDLTLIYNDKVLGCGPVNLSISAKTIQNAPSLAL